MRRLQRAANRSTTPDLARRLVAFAVRCVKDTPLPGGSTFAQRLAGHLGLLEAVQTAEGWLDGRPRHLHLHVDVVTPDSALRAAVHHLYPATRCADAGGTYPDKLGEAAGHACTAASKVRRPPGQTWPTPRALEYQERLLAEMFPGWEQVGCAAAR
jgi:hypothetical protein